MPSVTPPNLARTAASIAKATGGTAPSQNSKKLGSEIYVFSHLQTRQVVYSLQKAMKNNHALRQIPYNGKKTVPRALRKDLWSPLAQISFPPSSPASVQAGLDTLRRLREFRKLHETQWPESLAVGEDGKPISRKLRGRLLCDQKANSIADMAAAIKGVVEAEGSGEGKIEGEIVVRWKDVFDAEFAESWPEGVVHDKLVVGKNNRRVVEFEAEAEEGVEGKEIEGEQKRVRL